MAERSELNNMWNERWKDMKIGFHISSVHFFVRKHFDTLVNNEIEGKRILVPLCGASHDMAFFYYKGLTVVGIEFSDVGIKKFFDDQELTYTVEPCDGGNVFKHDDRLQIFQIDLFSTNPTLLGGLFDYWLDRGSLCAMVEEEQQNYVDHIISLMSPQARGFMECHEYEPPTKSPPRPIYIDRLNELFSGRYDAKELDRCPEEDRPTNHDNRIISPDLERVYYLLSAKQ